LGGNQSTTRIELAPNLEVELPVKLEAGDRLGMAVFTQENGQPGELVNVELPILSNNRWTPTDLQIDALPKAGFLELTPQLAAGGLAQPLFVPFSVP
jgi:hypothetical protein